MRWTVILIAVLSISLNFSFSFGYEKLLDNLIGKNEFDFVQTVVILNDTINELERNRITFNDMLTRFELAMVNNTGVNWTNNDMNQLRWINEERENLLVQYDEYLRVVNHHKEKMAMEYKCESIREKKKCKRYFLQTPSQEKYKQI